MAGRCAADKARVCTSLPVDLLLVDGAWRLLLLYMYVYVVETAACIAYAPARVCRLVMMSKYSCTMNAFVQAIQLVLIV